MKNVRIKKSPGDQKDFELVDMYSGAYDFSHGKRDSGVKDKLYPVDRDEANIEAEKDETIVGDINLDGYIQLMEVMGEKHSKGGTPLNVPEGSFVFSNTKELKIKDPEVLDMFGMPKSKKGYTPAEISKKFKLNDYIDVMKDENSDPISRRSANQMVQNNAKKLAELAMIQESMKDFEYGVPEFASQILDLPEAKWGGALTKYTTGGPNTEDFASNRKDSKGSSFVSHNNSPVTQEEIYPISPGKIVYINNEPYVYYDTMISDWGVRNSLTSLKSKNEEKYITLPTNEISRLINSGTPVVLNQSDRPLDLHPNNIFLGKMGYNPNPIESDQYALNPENKTIDYKKTYNISNQEYSVGDIVKYHNKLYYVSSFSEDYSNVNSSIDFNYKPNRKISLYPVEKNHSDKSSGFKISSEEPVVQDLDAIDVNFLSVFKPSKEHNVRTPKQTQPKEAESKTDSGGSKGKTQQRNFGNFDREVMSWN